MAIRVFKYDGKVINFDNNVDAERFLSDNPETEELSEQEIGDIFGEYAGHAGNRDTVIDEESNITFDATNVIAEEAAKAITKQRQTDIANAKSDNSLSIKTVSEINTFIDGIIDTKEPVEAIRQIAKAFAPYILK